MCFLWFGAKKNFSAFTCKLLLVGFWTQLTVNFAPSFLKCLATLIAVWWFFFCLLRFCLSLGNEFTSTCAASSIACRTTGRRTRSTAILQKSTLGTYIQTCICETCLWYNRRWSGPAFSQARSEKNYWVIYVTNPSLFCNSSVYSYYACMHICMSLWRSMHVFACLCVGAQPFKLPRHSVHLRTCTSKQPTTDLDENSSFAD